MAVHIKWYTRQVSASYSFFFHPGVLRAFENGPGMKCIIIKQALSFRFLRHTKHHEKSCSEMWYVGCSQR